jgi:hypothetical protein
LPLIKPPSLPGGSRGIVGAALGEWTGSVGQRKGDAVAQRRYHWRAGNDRPDHQAEQLAGADDADLLDHQTQPLSWAACRRKRNDAE